MDFRASPSTAPPSCINGSTVDIVSQYKYLGTIIDEKLKFDANTESLCKRGQQRLYCLRRLSVFQIDRTIMKMFYSAFIESAITFSIMCWYGNLSVKTKNSLLRIVKTASRITGVQFNNPESIYWSRVQAKANQICKDDSQSVP